MQLEKLLDKVRSLAPEHLAEGWDRAGLAVGDGDWGVTRAMLCIDLTPAVMEEAVAQRANLVIAYHPPIFEPLPRLLAEDWKQRLIMAAVAKRIAVYSPHTALDAVAGGVNDWLCEALLPGVVEVAIEQGTSMLTLKSGKVEPIRRSPALGDTRPCKLVTYVPPGDLEKVRRALFAAGAGRIGAYSECSFSGEGQGTFRGDAGTNPTIGKPGVLETAQERRLETIVPAKVINAVVAALLEAHPYEEPAFDLFRLDLPVATTERGTGQGRVVTLRSPITAATLAQRFKRHLGVKALHLARAAVGTGSRSRKIRRVALCAGAGGSLLQEAGEIDAFVTGEMRHHDILTATQRGVTVLLAGHTETERPYLPVYRRRLEEACGKGVTWSISRADKAP